MTQLPQIKQVKLRCSSLDALFSCTPSILGDDPNLIIRIGSSNDTAQVGKVIHELAEGYVQRAKFNIRDALAAAGMRLDAEDEIAKLMMYLMKGWDELKVYFPTPMVEAVVKAPPLLVDSTMYELAGTCDVLSPVGTHDAIFADWKSGFLDDSYHQQMAGYAYCIWCEMGRPDDAVLTGIVFFLRHRYYRIIKFDKDKLLRWEYDLTHNVLASGKFRPGKTCKYCDLYSSCPARAAVVHGTIDAILGGNGVTEAHKAWLADAKVRIATLTAQNKHDPEVGKIVEDLLFKHKLLQQLLDETHSLVRDAVKRVDGIPLPNGYQLVVRRLEIDRVIPEKAMTVLRQRLSDLQIMGSMSISLPKLVSCYAAAASGTSKGEARDALIKALAEAGAIATTTQERMEEVEVSLPQGGKSNVNSGSSDSQPKPKRGRPRKCNGAGGSQPSVDGCQPTAGGNAPSIAGDSGGDGADRGTASEG